jgi:hypothetical protein
MGNRVQRARVAHNFFLEQTMKLFTEQDLKKFVALVYDPTEESSLFDQIIRPELYTNHSGCAVTKKNIESLIDAKIDVIRNGADAYISGEDYRSDYDTYAIFETSPHYKLWLNSEDFRSEVCVYLIPVIQKMRDEFEHAE